MECTFDLIKSQNINLYKDNLGESRNQYSLNNIDILTPKNQFKFKNCQDIIQNNLSINQNNENKKENKKITIYNPSDSSKKFSPTYNYWERRYKENEILKENMKKVDLYKLLKELKNKPKTSKNNKEIEKYNRTIQKKKLTLTEYMDLKQKMLKIKEDIYLKNKLMEKLLEKERIEKMNKKNDKFKNIYQTISNKKSKSEKSFENIIDANIILNLNNSYNSQERILKRTYFNEINLNQEKLNHKNNIKSLIGEKLKFIDYSKQRFTDKVNYLNPNQSYLIYNPLLQNKFFYNSSDRINEQNKKKRNIENNSNVDNNTDIDNTKKKYGSLLKNERLIKYRNENNKRLEYLINNSNSNIEKNENEKLLNYELNSFNIDKSPKTLKQKYNTLCTKNDINSARNEIEFLNEKLKINEQRRKMFYEKNKYQNMDTNNNTCQLNTIDNNDSNTNFTKSNFSSEKLRIPNFTFQRKKYIIF